MNRKTLRKLLVGEFSFKRLVCSFIFIYACLLIFVWVWSNKMIFQPQPPTYEDFPGIIKLDLGGGKSISALHLVHQKSDYTVLYNHANAVDLGDIHDFLKKYHDRGFSVFSYDYRGYGTSSGRPTTGNACKDAKKALKYLVDQGIPTDRIIIHGRSIGGGPALYLARQNDVAGVIVESSFVTAFRVMSRVPLVPFDKFRNIARIGNVNCPVLVIHGRNDNTIPFWHGEKLYRKANQPKLGCWLDNTSHNYMPAEAEIQYWAAISSFAKLVDSKRTHAADIPGHSSPETEQGTEGDTTDLAL